MNFTERFFLLFISVPEIDRIENGAICKPPDMSDNSRLLAHERNTEYFPVLQFIENLFQIGPSCFPL